MSSISKTGFTVLAGALIAITVGFSAKAADQLRIRGTVESLDGNTLSVKTREGTDAKIMLKDGWKVSSVAKASITDIKEGDFVGIASLPTADGGNGALEVLIFPAAMKGTGEGSYAWDLKPNSSMTNATVANSVKSVDGHTLTVTYKGGEKKISIPDGTPVVTFASAVEADIKSGATVFVPSEKVADGSMSSGRIVVGTNGVVPPM
jgi:ribosome maturation factor RimP